MKLNSQDGYDAIILILWLTNVKEWKLSLNITCLSESGCKVQKGLKSFKAGSECYSIQDPTWVMFFLLHSAECGFCTTALQTMLLAKKSGSVHKASQACKDPFIRHMELRSGMVRVVSCMESRMTWRRALGVPAHLWTTLTVVRSSILILC